MRIVSRSLMFAILALAVLGHAALGEALTLRFQLDGLCNKVTLNFVPSGLENVLGIFGYDDNCGVPPRSPITGTVVVNFDGGFSIGYTTTLPTSVYPGSVVGLHTTVEWPADSDVGFWTDNEGFFGLFLFNILDQPSG
jgi:hypothetical protein